MHLVQLLLPLYSNSGLRFDQRLYTEVRNELVNRFGGISAYTRAPVRGLWQETIVAFHDPVNDGRLARSWATLINLFA